MDKPLFSLVIGVYNVEKYLQRCFDSIDQQVKNFEVIIIDDGSTDDSGVICDNWAINKAYVRVYHQKNCGISKTRNKGVQYSQGDYIVFIDPDDWIADSYTETLAHLINDNGGLEKVDIIGFNFRIVSELHGELKYSNSGSNYPDDITTGETALRWLLNNKIGNYAWQYAVNRRLYLANHIKFPDMILYEDAATIYRLLFFAKKIIFTNKPIYSYFQRANSFLHKSELSRTTEYFKLFEQMDTFFKAKKRNDLINQSREYKLPRLFAAYINLIRLDINQKEQKKYSKKISKMIKENFILYPSHLSTLIKEILFYTQLFKPMAYIHDRIKHIK